jgi:mono/diheme cytochrome c family protein
MNRLMTLTTIAAVGLTIAFAADSAQDHRDRMDEAADQKDQLKEELDAKSSAKAMPFADKLVDLLVQEQKYWVAAKIPEAVKLSEEALAQSKQVAAAAKAGKFDDANKAFAAMSTTCSTCHDLHPEKKLAEK